jgi:hypothetical protein
MEDKDLEEKYRATLSIINASFTDLLQRAAKPMSDKDGSKFAEQWEGKHALHQCLLGVFILNNTKGTCEERAKQLQKKYSLKRSRASVTRLIAYLQVLNRHPVLILGSWSRIASAKGLLLPNSESHKAKKVRDVHARLTEIKDTGVFKPFLTTDLFDVCPGWLSED